MPRLLDRLRREATTRRERTQRQSAPPQPAAANGAVYASWAARWQEF